MSIHIEAKESDIANVVLMPGDPLRARFMAKKFLTAAKLVSSLRGIEIWSGFYKDRWITIAASGMGFGSIAIYSHELFHDYGVEYIIRVGTCGSYKDSLELGDLILVSEAFSISTELNQMLLDNRRHLNKPSTRLNNLISLEAKGLGLDLVTTRVHSSEVFYPKKSVDELVSITNADVVEMESYALFAVASSLGKHAASILTVSDIIPNKDKHLTAKERVESLDNLFLLALESAAKLSSDLS